LDNFFGYNVGLFVNGVSATPDPASISFTLADSIYKLFPTLELRFSDQSGLFLEMGVFTQGIPLNIKFGIAATNKLLDVDFKSSSRDAPSVAVGNPCLNGNLICKGLHSSFFANRDAPNIALKDITIADAVKRLFQSESNFHVEETKGKIESYAFDDPYQFVQDVLLPQATNGKTHPYVFYRNLLNELHFESTGFIEDNSPTEKLLLGDLEEDEAFNTFYSFLPFNEDLLNTMINFNVSGKSLKNDLTFETIRKSIATDAKNKIPVVDNTKINHIGYFGRQFNPKVAYDQLNTAFCANAMKSGFFVDKALGNLSFHPELVAGKVVEAAVSLVGEDNKTELSETFSGSWLIEQSYHTWNGALKKGETSLILSRNSMTPRRGSIILDNAFSD